MRNRWATIILQLCVLLFSTIVAGLSCAGETLSPQEQSWIRSHAEVRIAIYPDYPPVSYLDKQGQLQGMVKDYLALIQQKTGLKYFYFVPSIAQQASNDPNVKSADVVAFLADTEERRAYWQFTEPFLKFPLYLITRNHNPNGLSLKDLSGKRVSVVGHWASRRYLEAHYPKIIIDSVESTCDGLQHVAFGQSAGMLTDLPVASWCMRDLGLMNLKLASKSEFNYLLGISVTKEEPVLYSIIQKGLAQISKQEHERIYDRWMSDSVFRQSWLERNELFLGIFTLTLLIFILVNLYAWDSRAQQRILGYYKTGLSAASDLPENSLPTKRFRKSFVMVTATFLVLLLAFYVLIVTHKDWYSESDRWVLVLLSTILGAITLYAGYKFGSVARSSLVERLMWRLKAQMKVRQASERVVEETVLRLERQNKAMTRLSTMFRDETMGDDEKYRWLTELCAYAIEVDRVSLWLMAEDGSTLQGMDLYQQHLHRHTFGQQLNAKQYPQYFSAMKGYRTLAVEDAMHDAMTQEFAKNYLPENRIGAMLDTIVWFEGRVSGVLCFEHIDGTRRWHLDEISFAGAIADLVQGLLENSRRRMLESDLAYQQKHLETIVRTRTAAIESNAKLSRFLVDRAPVSIVYLNAALDVIEVNPEAERMAGRKREDVLGRNFLEMARSEEREEQRAIFKRVLNGEKIYGQRASYKTADGRVIELSISRSMELDSDGNPVIISIAQDVSQQKALEDSLIRAREAAESADRIKSMFVASMSHELRTPLNSIIGFLGVVLQGMSGPINEVQKDQLGRAYQSAKHLLSLISDVIDISKIEAGFLQVHAETFELRPLLLEVESNVQHLVQEKHLVLTIECEKNIQMKTDRKRLYQVMLNLVSNAVKYTEKGWIKIAAKVAGDVLTVTVQDTGIGIDEAGLEKLFKPFERLDSHLKIKVLGTGLGLYLTHKILTQLLQGSISVQSQPGVGSIFTVTMPLEVAAQPTEVADGSILEDNAR